MFRPVFGLMVIALVGREPHVPPAVSAWPHRAFLTSLDGGEAAFRAYTLGRTFITVVAGSGELRPLTPKDTVCAKTPAQFPLDLSKGPVVFIADGTDSLRLVVGWNPWGRHGQVRAEGLKFTARLVLDQLVIDTH